MRKFLLALALVMAVGTGAAMAETATDGWSAGLGLSYPGYYLVNITTLKSNFGAYATIMRSFSEHSGLRLRAGYSHMEGEWTDLSLETTKQSTNLITADLDLLVYFVPCEMVSPYLFAGIGGNYKMITNGQTEISGSDLFGAQFNIGAGSEFKFAENWNLSAEIAYHITDNSTLEGTVVPWELNGRDSYLAINLGVNFLFGQGEPSTQCGQAVVGKGMSKNEKDRLRYNSAVVDRYILSIANDKLVLVGVNFAFDEATLTPESYAVLDKTVKLMKDRPAMKVEVQGYTDYVGTSNYNIELAAERANAVKDYIVSKGINESRLSVVSYGQTGSRKDNLTVEGREMNRRVVLKIVK